VVVDAKMTQASAGSIEEGRVSFKLTHYPKSATLDIAASWNQRRKACRRRWKRASQITSGRLRKSWGCFDGY
jgi:hypothetical protein